MGKKIKFISIIFVFVIALVGFYFYLKMQQKTVSTIYKAVPINAALVIDVNKPKKSINTLTKKNNFWQELAKFDKVKVFNSNLEFIDSIIDYKLIDNEIVSKKKLIISFHELGNKKFEPIYYSMLNSNIEAKQLIKNIEQVFKNKGVISTNKYNKIKIYDFKFSNVKNKHFYYCYYKGVFMISQSEMLLQDALRQIDADSGLSEQKQFVKLIETAGKYASANIYIQFKYFERMFGKLIDLQKLKQKGIMHYSEWGVLDLNIKNNTILLNGFSSSGNNKKFIDKVFDKQKPQTIKFVKHITNIPEAFSIIGISDVKMFRKKIANYMDEIGEGNRFNINEKSLQNTFGKNAVNKIEKTISNEVATVTQSNGKRIFALRTKGHRDAKELVEELLNHYCKTNKQNLDNYKKQYKIDDEATFTIYKMPLNKIPLRLFGTWFSQFEANYLVVFENYMVFADDYKTITNFIYDNVLQKTFAYNGNYKKFENYLSEKVNFYQFINLAGTGIFVDKSIMPKPKKYWKKNQKNISDFYGIGFQFSVEKNYTYNSLIFRYQPVESMQASTQWESKLDTTITFKPTLIKNHYTGEKEIFLQDEKNNIYLIGNTGRIIWKHKFDEKIKGKVQQVDFYKNGKLQLLFATENKIYLIDRNGNYVDKYPITLPQKATAPMAVFDYDNRKNYRIFIPCNKKIYAFNLEGKIVTGFEFSGADYQITKPVQYFQNSGKDYLVVADQKRTYILDRKGNERLKIKKQFVPSEKNEYTLLKKPNARLVTTDNKGNIKQIYLNGGDVKTTNFNNFSEKHYFEVYDIDGISEYIFIDKNELYTYTDKGKKIFTYKFDYPIRTSPAFYKFSANKVGIGITDAESGKIYLFNHAGKLFDGFPLNGKTQFSISSLSQTTYNFNLIVGGSDFYLYNYKLK